MSSWVTIMVIAVGGAMLLEDAMYALFPGPMKKAMLEMQSVPENILRGVGLGIATLGLVIIYLLVPK